jgi:uncharacterized membrane protein
MTTEALVLLVVYIAIIVWAVLPVAKQLVQPKVQHLVIGSAAAVSTLWWFRTGIYDGLDVHFLWLTALTLTLGWRWALLSSGIAMLVMASMGIVGLNELGIYGIVGAVIPVMFAFFMYMLAYHKLSKHFFVYVFFCSFFVGMLSIALKMTLFGVYFSLTDTYSWDVVVDNYLILIPLLLFPEGLLNGMTMTLLVIYKVDWVATFYDSQYLDGK